MALRESVICSVNETLESPTSKLKECNVVVLGLGRQGTALARYLCSHGAQVTISDHADASRLQAEVQALSGLPVEFALGGHPDSLLDNCDLLMLSGGVPPQIPFVQKAVEKNIPISNDSLVTLDALHRTGKGPIVGITGSSGKTTVTTLVGEMLSASDWTTYVGGNIGLPLVDRLARIKRGEPIVLELSSFQLELFDPTYTHTSVDSLGPTIACITNITPNHLDRHASMADYVSAKLNLIRTMPTGSTLVLNADDAITASLLSDEMATDHAKSTSKWNVEVLLAETRRLIAGRQIVTVPFSLHVKNDDGAYLSGDMLMLHGEPICACSDLRIRGMHNVSNMLAAAAVSHAAGATSAGIQHTATTFAGVPHRLEVVAEHNGVIWINDSIATAPERALAALRSFPDPDQDIILLAGGRDKKLPWDSFAAEVIKRVRYLIGFGHSGQMIVEHVQQHARFTQMQAPNCATVRRLEEAVELAARTAVAGSIVLLSPGGTSYDAYKDFEERGQHFKKLVRHLIAERAGVTQKAGLEGDNEKETTNT